MLPVRHLSGASLRRRFRKFAFCIALVNTLVTGNFLLFAQSSDAQAAAVAQVPIQPVATQSLPPGAPLTAGQSPQFKNLTVLKDIKPEELLPAMEAFNSALGVECTHCHVMGGGQGLASAALDDKWQKGFARQMIQVTMDLNNKGFAVKCATCHNGHEVPVTEPPIMSAEKLRSVLDRNDADMKQARAAAAGQPTAAAKAPVDATSSGAVPATTATMADQIIAKYEDAIGGETAIGKLTSQVAKGTITDEHGQVMPLELEKRSDDKSILTETLANGQKRRILVCCSGGHGWSGFGMLGAHQYPAAELENRFFRDLKLKDQYTDEETLSPNETIDGEQVYVVQAKVKDSHFTDKLYFDVKTGLLLRRLTMEETILGPIPQETDYSDYRDVAGIKVPFRVRHAGFAGTDNGTTRTWTKVDWNVGLPDSDFAPPAPRP